MITQRVQEKLALKIHLSNMKKTQIEWLKDELRNNGKVTRNMALQRYISRIAARVDDLRRDGWVIEGKAVKRLSGTDYQYTLIEEPQRTLWER